MYVVLELNYRFKTNNPTNQINRVCWYIHWLGWRAIEMKVYDMWLCVCGWFVASHHNYAIYLHFFSFCVSWSGVKTTRNVSSALATFEFIMKSMGGIDGVKNLSNIHISGVSFAVRNLHGRCALMVNAQIAATCCYFARWQRCHCSWYRQFGSSSRCTWRICTCTWTTYNFWILSKS